MSYISCVYSLRPWKSYYVKAAPKCPDASSKSRTDVGSPIDVLMNGRFEHPVDRESVYWLVVKDEHNLVIYIDKREDRWWKQLLIDEEVTVSGRRNYSVPMEHVSEGARMEIDKLIKDQRGKLIERDDEFSLA